MARSRRFTPFLVVAAFGLAAGTLAGCSVPIGLYHDVEGGAIAKSRQPPPGDNLPYPNLASVPQVPAGLTAGQTQLVTRRLSPTPPAIPATQANPAALAGLTLPGEAPPAPDVPGLDVPTTPAPHQVFVPPPVVAAAPVRVDSAPVSIAFAPNSAILNPGTVKALAAVAGGRGSADVLAGGFGDSASAAPSLTLALLRAQAIADALTAAGVPPNAIRLTAAAAGSGGFVQLVY